MQNIQKNNFNILLVGAGNLGSRYLQGLMEVKYSCAIYVIDYSTNALNLSKKRCNEKCS